jgi:Family of unknown function (DUF6194)
MASRPSRRLSPTGHGWGSDVPEAMRPAEILAELRELDPELRLERYYSEQALFYNPGRQAPLGVIFAAIKDHDGPNDHASRLSRAGVFRFAFQLAPDEFSTRFGQVPARPPRGGVVSIDTDPAALNRLSLHPVYAWMRWVQILVPTVQRFAELRPSLEDSLTLVRRKWKRRRAA